MTDPFEILGLKKNSSAKDIRTAYVKLALKHHPDRPGGNRDKYCEISEAYNKLLKRNSYEKLDISGFEKFYRNTDEEKEEIKTLYLKHKGDICKIIDNMLIGKNEDEDRIREIIAEYILRDKITDFPLFNKKVAENKRRLKKMEKEAILAEKLRDEYVNRVSLNKDWREVVDELAERYGVVDEKKRISKKKQ